MNIHLVAGFLGSGKTTAVLGLSHILRERGDNVATVSNDQGRNLVDTAAYAAAGLPVEEITGGCFCCRLEELEGVLSSIRLGSAPEFVFAEAVGSCADIVATVVKPLGASAPTKVELKSCSTFVDIRLLGQWLRGEALPFSSDVSYIFAKQIEEASLLIANKVDLLSTKAAASVKELAAERLAEKTILYQCSFRAADLERWRDQIDRGTRLPGRSLSISYERYGAGEAELAWYNGSVRFESAGRNPRQTLQGFLTALRNGLLGLDAAVGHVKLMLPHAEPPAKLSLTFDANWDASRIPLIRDSVFEMIINARVQCAELELKRVIREAVREGGGPDSMVVAEESFHPSFPRPARRLP